MLCRGSLPSSSGPLSWHTGGVHHTASCPVGGHQGRQTRPLFVSSLGPRLWRLDCIVKFIQAGSVRPRPTGTGQGSAGYSLAMHSAPCAPCFGTTRRVYVEFDTHLLRDHLHHPLVCRTRQCRADGLTNRTPWVTASACFAEESRFPVLYSYFRVPPTPCLFTSFKHRRWVELKTRH